MNSLQTRASTSIFSLQISMVCGARHQGYFARPQFFIACKLIAAAQNGLPVMLDSLNSGRDLPLPKFALHLHQEPGKSAHLKLEWNVSMLILLDLVHLQINLKIFMILLIKY